MHNLRVAAGMAGKQCSYLQPFSFCERCPWRAGIPSSSVIIRDIRVSEVSYSTSSATYALEVDVMVLFTSAAEQMERYQLLLSGDAFSVSVRCLTSLSVYSEFSSPGCHSLHS